MAINKLSLFVKLLQVYIGRPNECGKYIDSSREGLNVSIEFFLVLIRDKTEEDVHHHRSDNHYHRDVDETVVQARN